MLIKEKNAIQIGYYTFLYVVITPFRYLKVKCFLLFDLLTSNWFLLEAAVPVERFDLVFLYFTLFHAIC